MKNVEIVKNLYLAGDRDICFACEYLKKAGFNLNLDGGKAKNWCEEEARNGVPEAQYVLAKFYQIGLNCDENKEQSLFWCKKAVETGYLPAIYMLAGFYEMGWGGLQPDTNHTLVLIEEAAAKGYPAAITTLATMYGTGHIVEKNRDKSLAYYYEAANLGDSSAQCSLGEILLEQGDSSVNEGIEWIQKAAKQKYSRAHRLLGYFYMDGSHALTQDEKLSRYHFDLASEIEDNFCQ